MSIPRLLTTSATALALLTAGSTAATAATVAQQETLRAPAKAPVTFPGAHKRRGDALRGKERVVSFRVTVTGREKKNLSISCPSGTKHAGLGVREGERRIGFNVVRPFRYTGKRRVLVQAYGRVARDRDATGTIYALCR